ncbi:putative UBX domain, PUB domain, TUG ubiquitin-like domain, Ubiquitin-like domain superfamily [Plasmopara halstedii]
MALNVTFSLRSKRVRVQSDTPMFQVLAEARDQFGLSDSRQYQLLHRGSPIDLSIPFGLTGISNNASLEIKEPEGMDKFEEVRVCVQLCDGKRVQATFGSNSTMEHILTYLKLLPALKQFPLGFLRRKIEPHALATTTLNDLGIIRGSAMFRILAADEHSSPASPRSQGFSVAKEIPKQSLDSSKRMSSMAPSISTAFQHEPLSRYVAPHTESQESIDIGDSSVMASLGSSRDALQLLRNSSFDAVSRIAITTLMKVITNVLSDPENDKVRSISLSNSVFNRSVGQVKGGLEFLKSIGFTNIPETQMLVLPSSIDKRLLEEGLRLLNIEADDLNISLEARPAVRERKDDSDFDIFKAHITRVQMQPRGPSTTEFLVESLKNTQHRLVGNEKPLRNTIITVKGRRACNLRDPSTASIEDEHAEQNDANLLMLSFKARRKEMETKKNFRTKAMRQLEELRRKKVFQSALIRVQFSDGAVLQASFQPSETIKDVMEHVTECLAEQYSASKFYLYVSPPTQKLNNSKTLTELNLVPAALIYLSWLEVPQAETASIGFYLRNDLWVDEQAETKDNVTLLQIEAFPQPLQYDQSSNSKSQVEPTQRSPLNVQAKAVKKPSWLKL